MILVTTFEVPGHEVEKTLGLVRGNSVRARHIGHDIMAGLKNIVGGEIPEYTKMMAQSREEAISRMKEQAEKMGGNAIVGVRFTTSMAMQGAAELLVYGTAVVLSS